LLEGGTGNGAAKLVYLTNLEGRTTDSNEATQLPEHEPRRKMPDLPPLICPTEPGEARSVHQSLGLADPVL